MSGIDPISPPGEPAPELLDGRIWVDGCWDFFHHGSLHFVSFHSPGLFAKNVVAQLTKTTLCQATPVP